MMRAARITSPTYDGGFAAASAGALFASRVRRCALLLAISARAAAGQAAPAQRVALEVRPRVGDTLRVSLEHALTLTGPRGTADSAMVISTTYHVLTRDVVERADAKSSTILAIIDSVWVTSSGTLGANLLPGVDPRMQRSRLRLQVMPDGSTRVVPGPAQLDTDLQRVLGEMPAVLPAAPVAPGESWTRELALPAIGAPATTSGTGRLLATFRLDSLTANGDRAWISVRGRVEPAGPNPAPPNATQVSGTLTGAMQLDRRRGWVAEWRAVVNLESASAPVSGVAPMVVTVRFQHSMRTAPSRR